MWSVDEALSLLGGGLDPDAVGAAVGHPLIVVDLDDVTSPACGEPAPGVRPAGGADDPNRPAPLSRFAELSRRIPWVSVGVSRRPEAPDVGTDVEAGFDVLVSADPRADRPWVATGDIDTTLGMLSTGVAGAPAAAVSLVQLLRAGENLDVDDAIVAESWVYSMLQSGEDFAAWLAHRGPVRPTEDDAAPVIVTRNGGILDVELNRPSRRNALNAAMRDGLIDALQIAAADESVSEVRLRGRGRDFCSGGDLDEFGRSPDPVAAHHVRVTRSVGGWVHRCASRVEAHLHGACIGAGIEIPAFATRVRASKDTTFTLPELTMGLIPGAAGTASIPRRIGRHRTAYLALTAVALPASTALAWGLVDAVED
jgi:Enoyl-CoA hydratase/isomerase